MTEETIFIRALEKPAEQRAAFLDEACAGDEVLRQRLESLLQAHDNPGSFLGGPAAGRAAIGDVRGARGTGEAAGRRPGGEGPGTRIGPYKLLQVIGEGGMGTVYMAEQTAPVRRTVALKVIKPGMDSRQVLARFDAERQALALMDHPNIARVLDAGTTEQGRPYFVMELVRGVPITKFSDERRLTPRERLELFIPVCQAVQHAHQKGVIHRDIKPSNVLMALYDGNPVPKVIDFGVAKATGQKLTEATLFTGFGAVVGTPEYMSPEQAELNQLDVDTRSDIYALGVLLYELLTGSTPLDRRRLGAAAILEVLRRIREEEHPRPSSRLSTTEELPSIAACRNVEPRMLTGLVRGELDWIVMKALEKDRGRRYQTANGLAADIRRHLVDEPVQACPPSAAYRLQKFARRNRRGLALAMALGLAILVAVVAVAASVGWAIRDRETRRAAVEQEASLAIDEAEGWIEQENWQKASQAIKRGEGVLAGGGREEIRARLRRQERLVSMMLRFQEVDYLALELRREWLEYGMLQDGYAKAFADLGIDVMNLPVDEAAARLRSEVRLAPTLVRGLDTWASVAGPEAASRLRAIAGLADADPWRREVREALVRRDGKALAGLAGSSDLGRQSRDDLAFLESSLDATGRPDLALSVRRLLQRNHPGDFMVNYWLAYRLFWATPYDPGEVISFARVAVALRPQTPAARLLLALALQRGGRLDEALHHHDRAVELAPENPFVYHDRGWTLHLMGRYDEAVASDRRAIELWDRDHFAYGNLAQSLKALKRPEEAIAAWTKSAEFDPDPVPVHLALGDTFREQRKFREAMASYHRAAELDPRDARVPLAIAGSLSEEGKLDEAVAMFNEVIARDPRHAAAYHELGRLLVRKGQWDLAVTNYRKSLELDPDATWPNLSLGLVLTTQKRPEEADAHYRRAIELDPNIPQFHFHRGWNWILRGNDVEASSCFRSAIRLARNPAAPFHSSLHRLFNVRAWRLATDPKSEERRPAIAVELAAEAVRLQPGSGEHWNTLGVAHYRNGDFEAAIRALTTSMERHTAPEGFNLFFLAMARWRLGNPSEARRCYEKAVGWMDSNMPQNADLIRFRAEAAELLGDAREGMPNSGDAFLPET